MSTCNYLCVASTFVVCLENGATELGEFTVVTCRATDHDWRWAVASYG